MDTAIKKQTGPQEAASDTTGPRRMLNQEQVLQIVPVSPVTLWRMEKKGLFPKSSYISPNRRVWFADEIIRWQEEVNGRARGRANQLPIEKPGHCEHSARPYDGHSNGPHMD